jgi:hypothetical protein
LRGLGRRLVLLQVFGRNPLADAGYALREQILALARQLFLLINAEDVELIHVEVFATGKHRRDRKQSGQQ